MRMNHTFYTRLFWATVLLLLIALSRTLILNEMHLSQDEARSILRSFGTPQEIIAWQPLDWPPLYNLLLGAWQALIDAHPAILRSLSVLLFLPGAALTFQLGRKLYHDERVAWGAMLAYSALGYSLFLSTFLRGYAISIAVLPGFLLLTIRYFDRPSLRRAFLVAVAMALLYYSTYTSVFGFLIAGVYTLITYRRAVWRWWLPGLMSFVMAVPDLLTKANFLRDRVESASDFVSHLPPLVEGIGVIFDQYLGAAALVWVILFVGGAILLFIQDRARIGRTLWLMFWVALAPLMVYALVATSIMFIFSPRYSWWGLLGIALVIGAGLAYLPRRIWPGLAGLMLVLMFVPLPFATYREDYLPIESVFSWLRDNALPGDVLVLDNNWCVIDCGRGEAWVYYTEYYLHDSVEIIESDDVDAVIDDPINFPRVWYLKVDGWHDEAMADRISDQRLGGKFVGPWDMLVRLYEAPPDIEGVLFDNGMRFHGFQVLDENETRVLQPPYDIRELATLKLRLWWSVDHTLEAEYSLNSLIIADRRRQVLAETNGPPQLVHFAPNTFDPLPQSMLEWVPEQYYVEERLIEIPALSTWYRSGLYLIVYQWWDQVRIAAPGENGTNSDNLLLLDDILVMGW